ncbi:MAG: hypothetical protein ACLUW6_00980 [Coriobacteriaceae bacterium]
MAREPAAAHDRRRAGERHVHREPRHGSGHGAGEADLPVGELRVLQRQTADVAAQLIAGADVLVLADGEGEDADDKRAAFFGELDMPALLEDAKDGALVIALSETARDAIR